MAGPRKRAQAPVHPDDEKAVAAKKLPGYAKEINVRFEKAAKLDGQADDHRLAAALQLAEAKKVCAAAGVGFRKWCEENVVQAYETVRGLVRVGEAPEPAKALADFRKTVRESVARTRAAQGVVIRKTTPVSPSGRAPTDFQIADETLRRMGDQSVALIQSHAQTHGLAVVSATEAKALANKGMEAAKAAFEALTTTEKGEFMKWAAALTGFALVNPLEAQGEAQGPGELPAFLRRPQPEKSPAEKPPSRRRRTEAAAVGAV